MSLRKISKKRLAELAAQGEPLPRSTLRAKGGSRFPKMRDPEYKRWVKRRPCLIGRGCWHPQELVLAGWLSDPAHVNKTQAQGAADAGEIVNLCRTHHEEQEGRTAEFNAAYGMNLGQIAKQLWVQYEASQGKPRL